ncbi:methylthioribulose 1-phosphate dehydratase [Kitasatospora sp. NPDC093550]|uniref:methylthioribulose 1-phosphate dehydratase n=1 Tax=Kitasatospora sp. NPDC093550 TaxID=3364089 RepID=UPI0037F78470
MTAPAATAAASDTERATTGSRLAELSRDLYRRGWMPGTAGNISALLPGDRRALITASGRDKGELTADDMVLVHADSGRPLAPGALRPSAETSIHAAVYRTTGAGAVIHVHAPYATATASRYRGDRVRPLRLEHFELLKGLGLADPAGTDLPVFPNWPDVGRIADDVADHLARTPQAPPGLLIAHHGITAWGRDLAEARNRLECLEAICQLLVLGTEPAGPATHDPAGPATTDPIGRAATDPAGRATTDPAEENSR